MADSIKISALDEADLAQLSLNDQLIVNDADRTDKQTITHRASLNNISTFYDSLDHTFTDTVKFTDSVTFTGFAWHQGNATFSEDVLFLDNVRFGSNQNSVNTQIEFSEFVDVVFQGNQNGQTGCNVIFEAGSTITGIELNDLDDVDGTPSDGEALVWNDSSNRWEPSPAGGGVPTPELDYRYLVHVGPEPSNPVAGMLWLRTEGGVRELYVYTAILSASSTADWYLTRPDGLLIGDGLPSARTTTYVPPASEIPQSRISEGTPGEFVADSNYLYFCVSDNTWIKTLIVPFDEETQVLQIE
jgi:hypothetical protein